MAATDPVRHSLTYSTFPDGKTVTLVRGNPGVYGGTLRVQIASGSWNGTKATVKATIKDQQTPPARMKIVKGTLLDQDLPITINWTQATAIPTTMEGIDQFHDVGGTRFVRSAVFSKQQTTLTKIFYKFGPEDGSDYTGFTVNETFGPWKCDLNANVFNDKTRADARTKIGREPVDGTDIIEAFPILMVTSTFAIETDVNYPGKYIIPDSYSFQARAQSLADRLNPANLNTVVEVARDQTYSAAQFKNVLTATAKFANPALGTQQVKH